MKRIYKLCTVLILTITLFSGCSEKKTQEKTTSDTNYENQNSTIDELPENEEAEQAEIHSLSFIGCGDNIIYGTKEARIHAQNTGSSRPYNYKPYYADVSDIINDADIAFINQETLMCGDGYSLSYYPMFNSPQELGYDLKELGFDVVNIANNHMLDKGADGLESTISFWKDMDGVVMTGGYENQQDYDTVRYIEKDGIKIAFLSYAEMTNGLTKSPYSDVVIPYLDDQVIIRQTQKAKQEADLVMVSVHWGQEGAFTPNDEQKRIAQLFADCGVDVILGHHPHVLQPVEWLCGKDGNKTLCVYSLGNFMAQQAYDYNMVGGIISFDIVYSEDFEPYVDNAILLPTVFHFNGSFTGNNVYLMENYTPELAAVHGVRTYYGHTLSYDRLLKYATDTIDESFLPTFFKKQEE